MSVKDSEIELYIANRFRAILEQSPFSIQVLSPDGFTVQVNKAWEKLWGVTLEQISHYNMLEDEQLVKKGIMPFIKRAFDGEASEIPPILYEPEESIPDLSTHKEGRWTKGIIYPIKDENGKVLEVVLMHEDITAQMRAEDRLKVSEQRYRTLFETTLDCILIVNEQGTYVDVNESLCRMLKATREKLIGAHFTEYMVPERLEEARSAFAALAETGVFAGSFPLRASDGTIVELEWVSRANFMPGLHVCFARDVTESKKAEEALRRSEARYRSLLENANDIIYSHDLQGTYLSINRAGEEITGYSREDVLGGMKITELVAPEHHALAREMTARKLKDPAMPTVYEIDIISKSGQRLTLEVSTRISYENGAPVAVEGVARDVTARRTAEKEKARLAEQIENQRKHLQAMVSSVPGVVWESWGEPDAASQRIDFVSDYVTEMLGYTVEEWLSTPNFWLSIVHPDDRETAARTASETFKSGQPGTNEFRWMTKDGHALWVESQSVAVFDEQGNPVGMRGVTMDISGRKQKEFAEKFLAEASSTLSSSLDYETTLRSVARLAVPHFADWCSVDMVDEDERLKRLAVAHVDPEKVRWAHEIYERYPPEPTDPQGIYNVLRTGEAELYSDIPDELLAAGARDAEHLEIMTRVGLRSALIVPLKIRDHVLGVLSFVNTDSSHRYTADDLNLAENLASRAALAIDNARLFRAEQRTRREAERTSDFLLRLQSVSSSLSQALTPEEVAVAVVEQGVKSLGAHAGTVVLHNQANASLEIVGAIGFTDDVKSTWRSFSIDEDVPIAEAVRERSPVVVESLSEHYDKYPKLGPLASITGTRSLAAFPMIVEGRTIGALGLSFPEIQRFSEADHAFMLALAHQCGQAIARARLYENEQHLRRQAEAANRMKDEFLATVSHELRTPLNAIVGWSSLLMTRNFDQQVVENAIQTIGRSARAQSQIIEDLLDVSRIVTGKMSLDMRATEIDAIITSTLDGLQPSAVTKGIRVTSNFDREAALVWGDADRLQQVMWNLLSNAIKFTPAGGDVEVAVERADASARIRISDTGQGIKREFLPFVFDRFSQADGSLTRKYGGLGLGLAIVRHLVEMHGGRVDVESAGENRGTTFTVEIPLWTGSENDGETPAPNAENVATAAAGSLGGLRVLIVDDDTDARLLLKTILETSGAGVSTADSVRSALEILRHFRPDILISDIGMPGEDGYSLIRRIRALGGENENLPAIALTAYARAEDRANALEAGFQMHLPKPVDAEELIARVRELIDAEDQAAN